MVSRTGFGHPRFGCLCPRRARSYLSGSVCEPVTPRRVPNAPQLAMLGRQFDMATDRAKAVVAALSPDALMRRPATDIWSPAECLTHLSLTAHIFKPLLDQAIDAARAHGLRGAGPYRMDLVGRVMRWIMEPPYRVRTKSAATVAPIDVGPPAQVLPAFVAAQDVLIESLHAADGVALDRATIISPFNRRIRYNLLSMFAILAAHERRHLWQAERASAAAAVR
jgi:hypothetical protein